MKIAVTGAFSYTGRYITKRLLAQGHEVITLTGHPNRSDPFGGKVKAFPLSFDVADMAKNLAGVDTLYNTYWIRFDKGKNTQPQAVENTRKLVNAAKALMDRGASSVSAYISHGVLSGAAMERVEKSVLKELVITDSIEATAAIRANDKVRIVGVAPLIGEAIRRIANEESVSKLFD